VSYTPDDQLLTKPIEDTVAGIDAMHSAIQERSAHASEWTPEHLNEIEELDIDLMRLRQRLVRLGQGVR
jgi:hypothetical protein